MNEDKPSKTKKRNAYSIQFDPQESQKFDIIAAKNKRKPTQEIRVAMELYIEKSENQALLPAELRTKAKK